MQNINDDNEYYALKEQVKNSELAAMLWGGLTTLAFGAAYLMFVAGVVGTAAAFGYAALGIVGVFSGYKAFRAGQDVRFDTNEMEARREAINLTRAPRPALHPVPIYGTIAK